MSIYRWIKFISVLALLISVFSVSAASPDLVEAGGQTVINVPAGDVAALYDAVYDQNGQPRNNVEINLEAGVFALDPLHQPHDGRLILGDNTTLRSTLEMAVDVDGIPLADENGVPTVLVEGAKIDGSGVGSTFFGTGIIEVGDQGSVEQLSVDGGDNPFAELTSGIEITTQGIVREVYSIGHFIGVRVRAKGAEADGIVEGSLLTGNALGISILSIEPTFTHPTGSNVEVQATIRHNTIVNNLNFNLLLNGAFSANDNELSIEVLNNVFRGAESRLGNIGAAGGREWFAPGSNNNEVELILVDNLIADGVVGIDVGGGQHGFFADFSLPLEVRKSSDNEVKVSISDTTFENNTLDIRVTGSLSISGEPGGDNNEAKVEIEGVDPETLTIEVHDCFPEEDFPTCTNEAEVTFE